MALTAEQIAQWTKDGQWPPPPVITIMPEMKPDPQAVLGLFHLLKNVCTPGEAAIVDKIIVNLSNEENLPLDGKPKTP